MKQPAYIKYVIVNYKICPNQHADFLRFFFTEDSLKIQKEPGSSFQAKFFIEFLDKNFYFQILYKLAKFHYQTVFTSQVIQ